MAKMRKSEELWRVYVKIGKQPWEPTMHIFTAEYGGETDAKATCRILTQPRRKYKAVRYVPERN